MLFLVLLGTVICGELSPEVLPTELRYSLPSYFRLLEAAYQNNENGSTTRPMPEYYATPFYDERRLIINQTTNINALVALSNDKHPFYGFIDNETDFGRDLAIQIPGVKCLPHLSQVVFDRTYLPFRFGKVFRTFLNNYLSIRNDLVKHIKWVLERNKIKTISIMGYNIIYSYTY